jgi:hypothetical protein
MMGEHLGLGAKYQHAYESSLSLFDPIFLIAWRHDPFHRCTVHGTSKCYEVSGLQYEVRLNLSDESFHILMNEPLSGPFQFGINSFGRLFYEMILKRGLEYILVTT